MMQEDCSVLSSIKLLTSQIHFKTCILCFSAWLYFTQGERPSQTLKMCSYVALSMSDLFLNWFLQEWRLSVSATFSGEYEGKTLCFCLSECSPLGLCMKRCLLRVYLLTALTILCASFFSHCPSQNGAKKSSTPVLSCQRDNKRKD